jgi:hypothetical protein
MVLSCTPLNTFQQDKVLHVFSKYAPLFDGTLGKIPNKKVHLELKQGGKPFCAKAYRIPHHIIDIAPQEVEELFYIGVLQNDMTISWKELRNEINGSKIVTA